MKNRCTTGGKPKDSSVRSLEHKPMYFKDQRINLTFTKAYSFSTVAGNNSVNANKTTVKISDHYNHNTNFGKTFDQRIRETHELYLT